MVFDHFFLLHPLFSTVNLWLGLLFIYKRCFSVLDLVESFLVTGFFFYFSGLYNFVVINKITINPSRNVLNMIPCSVMQVSLVRRLWPERSRTWAWPVFWDSAQIIRNNNKGFHWRCKMHLNAASSALSPTSQLQNLSPSVPSFYSMIFAFFPFPYIQRPDIHRLSKYSKLLFSRSSIKSNISLDFIHSFGT